MVLACRTDAQRCDEPRYRWSQKVDTSRLSAPARTVTIRAMLTEWDIPAIGGPRASRCAPRSGRELEPHTVTGWLRRIETSKDDGDWHLELTERRNDRVGDCIVAEIPLPRYHREFARARAVLDTLISGVRIDRQGDLSRPVRITITGKPFYDGQHLAGKKRLVASEHGRCNSSARALWEIHPVHSVSASPP